jgi:hypothetical protein
MHGCFVSMASFGGMVTTLNDLPATALCLCVSAILFSAKHAGNLGVLQWLQQQQE